MADHKPPYRIGALVGSLVFFLYVLTLAPSTAWWDASEYIATSHILGIPHPPGNPLFVVLTKAWTLLLAPLGLSIAVRVNLLAAFTSALSSFFMFLVIHRILTPALNKRLMVLVGSAAGTLIGATTYTVWNQSNVTEKVYPISVMVIAAVSWLALRWYDNRDNPRGTRALIGAVYMMVLGSTNHLMSVLAFPALGLFVLLAQPGVLLRRSFLTRVIPLAIIGISFNFFLPIRAAEGPVINEGEPVCASVAGATLAVYTNGRAGCPALSSSLTREQYAKAPLSDRQAPIGHQLGNFLQWFDWQWARGADLSEQPLGGRLPFTMLFTALGLMGLILVWQVDRMIFAYVATLLATLSVGLVVYMNFEYGYSLAPYILDPTAHEVRERDYFFVASFLLWGALSGIGLAGLWGRLSEAIGAKPWLASPILLIAAIPLVFNWGWADRSGDYAARDWAYDMLQSVEPYGILFTAGDNDTFPLWYAQEVEGVRKDVTVIVGEYLRTDWYVKQLKNLTEPSAQRPFLDEFALGVYATPDTAPAHSLTTMADQDLDAIMGVRLSRDQSIPLGPVSLRYRAGTYLDRVGMLALRIVSDSIDDRPIYFTQGSILSTLGLGNWGVHHGLATKLVMRDLRAEESSNGLVRGRPEFRSQVFDVERSLALVNEVYSYRGLRDREIWPDDSTLGIPLQYQIMFTQLADVAQLAGRPAEELAELQSAARAFRTVARGGTRAVVD